MFYQGRNHANYDNNLPFFNKTELHTTYHTIVLPCV
jgi:hypothetical protein